MPPVPVLRNVMRSLSLRSVILGQRGVQRTFQLLPGQQIPAALHWGYGARCEPGGHIGHAGLRPALSFFFISFCVCRRRVRFNLVKTVLYGLFLPFSTLILGVCELCFPILNQFWAD